MPDPSYLSMVIELCAPKHLGQQKRALQLSMAGVRWGLQQRLRVRGGVLWAAGRVKDQRLPAARLNLLMQSLSARLLQLQLSLEQLHLVAGVFERLVKLVHVVEVARVHTRPAVAPRRLSLERLVRGSKDDPLDGARLHVSASLCCAVPQRLSSRGCRHGYSEPLNLDVRVTIWAMASRATCAKQKPNTVKERPGTAWHTLGPSRNLGIPARACGCPSVAPRPVTTMPLIVRSTVSENELEMQVGNNNKVLVRRRGAHTGRLPCCRRSGAPSWGITLLQLPAMTAMGFCVPVPANLPALLCARTAFSNLLLNS